MATTTTLGKVSLTMGGNYSPTATYDRLTVVRGVSGNSYVTTVDGVSGISPGVTSGWENYWQLFAADGEGGGGGGSNVVVTPIVTTGTKIATITVDGEGADLYAPEGGGGSEVSVTPIVTTGTKIATITVDGQDSDLYAPAGGGGTVTDVQVNGTSVVNDGVANIPRASESALGVVKVANNYPRFGLEIVTTGTDAGKIKLVDTTDAQVKAGLYGYPVQTSKQHAAAFYGLAKAAGDTTQASSSNPVGTYTAEAKAAIQAMIGAGVEVVRLA